jgi:hypothetical protein
LQTRPDGLGFSRQIAETGGNAMAEKFNDNLLRMIAAELHALTGLTAAREMYGKSYFSLGFGEKAAVDQAVIGMVGGQLSGHNP